MKKIIFIILVISLYITSLYTKDYFLNKSNNKNIPTTYYFWNKDGVPVKKTKVIKSSLAKYSTISGKFQNGKLKTFITPQLAQQIQKNSQALIILNDQEIQGEITQISSNPNIFSGLYEITIQFKNHSLQEDNYIVKIKTHEELNVLLLNKNAISLRNDEPFVYLIDDNNIIHKKSIKLGSNNLEYYVIEQGLKEKDQVVMSDLRYLNEGQKVLIVN